MEEAVGPIVVKESGTVIENMIIYGEPTDDSKKNDYTLKIIGADNVVVRNVILYHAANTMGIFAVRANNLLIENVEVIAYGNDWGTAPCPSRAPFHGADCTNIKVRRAENLRIKNVSVENGSRGISLVNATRAYVTGVVAKNARGAYPAGQCV